MLVLPMEINVLLTGPLKIKILEKNQKTFFQKIFFGDPKQIFFRKSAPSAKRPGAEAAYASAEGVGAKRRKAAKPPTTGAKRPGAEAAYPSAEGVGAKRRKAAQPPITGAKRPGGEAAYPSAEGIGAKRRKAAHPPTQSARRRRAGHRLVN